MSKYDAARLEINRHLEHPNGWCEFERDNVEIEFLQCALTMVAQGEITARIIHHPRGDIIIRIEALR